MFAAERKEADMGVCVVSLQKENRGHIRGPNTVKRVLNRTNGSTKLQGGSTPLQAETRLSGVVREGNWPVLKIIDS